MAAGIWMGARQLSSRRSKIQNPRSREDPRSKSQIPIPEFEIAKSKIECPSRPGEFDLVLGAWIFPESWILDLGSFTELFHSLYRFQFGRREGGWRGGHGLRCRRRA